MLILLWLIVSVVVMYCALVVWWIMTGNGTVGRIVWWVLDLLRARR